MALCLPAAMCGVRTQFDTRHGVESPTRFSSEPAARQRRCERTLGRRRKAAPRTPLERTSHIRPYVCGVEHEVGTRKKTHTCQRATSPRHRQSNKKLNSHPTPLSSLTLIPLEMYCSTKQPSARAHSRQGKPRRPTYRMEGRRPCAASTSPVSPPLPVGSTIPFDERRRIVAVAHIRTTEAGLAGCWRVSLRTGVVGALLQRGHRSL